MEIYKSVNRLSPKFDQPKYNIQRGNHVKLPFLRNAISTNSFDFRTEIAWNKLPISSQNYVDGTFR